MLDQTDSPVTADARSPHSASSRVMPLPQEPLYVVEPGTSHVLTHLHDLWTCRELLYFLVWRDVKIRYKQTLLGAAWAIVQPLLTMLVFTLIFSTVANIDSNGIPYPVFAYAALWPWTFFATAITTSGQSVVGSTALITKVYFPRLIIPVAAVVAGVVDLAVAFPVLVALMAYYHTGLTPNLLMLLPLVLLTTLLAAAVGIWLSALNVKYRDVKFAIPFLVQIWMYLSPIAYPATVVPDKWQRLYSLNPLVGIIEAYRAALFGRAFDWGAMLISVVITLGLVAYAVHQFRQMEKGFADIL